MINTAAPASNSVYGREKLFRYEKIIFSNQAVFCFLVPFFFFSIFFFSLFVFVVTVDPAGHAAWINISIYILSLSPEFYFAKGISKALDLHTGHAYDQKKKKHKLCFSVIWHHDKQHTVHHRPLGARFGEWGIGPCNLWASQHHNLRTKFKDKREGVSVP